MVYKNANQDNKFTAWQAHQRLRHGTYCSVAEKKDTQKGEKSVCHGRDMHVDPKQVSWSALGKNMKRENGLSKFEG